MALGSISDTFSQAEQCAIWEEGWALEIAESPCLAQ
jgi:hypothetical protein